jgi:transcription initiation factor TFIIIB Brf1 subunit/transcription initiation factor TFIIB
MKAYCPKCKQVVEVYWDNIENELLCEVCDSCCERNEIYFHQEW